MAKKASPDVPQEKTQRACLYEIIGIEKNATESEIKKAYRVRALQSHPDKDPSPEAKLNFQKLHAAYSILKNPESRKLYDETGYVEGDGFETAADFFVGKFGRISEQDIVDFAGKYRGSEEEEKDVIDFYLKHEGDVSDLLEWIPLSDPSEVERFVQLIEVALREKKLIEKAKYKASLLKLRKNAIRMEKEQARFSKSDPSGGQDLNALALAIRGKREKASESFLEELEAKYAKALPSKKKLKK